MAFGISSGLVDKLSAIQDKGTAQDAVQNINLPMFGNQNQFSASDISNFIQQNVTNPQAIAQAAQQYNISPQDIQIAAGYSPTTQAEYLGGAGLPSLQPLTIEQLYKDVLGRPSDTGGAQYWAQKFGTTIDPNEIAEFRSAAAPEIVRSAYQNVLGRQADLSGEDYYTQQLRSKELSQEKLNEVLAAGAQGLTDRLQAQNYFEKTGMLPTTSAFGYDLFPELNREQEKKLEKFVNSLALGNELTPSQAAKLTKYGAETGFNFFDVPTYKSVEEALSKRTGGVDFQAITDYVNQNIDDPTKIYQRAAELGITPEEVLLAYSATGQKGRSPYSLQQIQDYFETGKQGYQDAFTDILTNTFGAEAATSAANLFKPEDFANKSIESIQETLQNSTANKNQEALRLAGTLANIYGYDQKQAIALAREIASGKVEDEGIMSVYNGLLKENALTNDLQTQLLQHIAKTDPDAEIFKSNPDLLDFYTPIEKLIESPKDSGQYGYNKNVPILSAKEADRLLGGEVFKGGNDYFGYGGSGEKDDSLGWDLRSKYLGSITNGAGIFGVKANQNQIDDFSRIQQEIDRLGGLKIVQDMEGGSSKGIYVTRKDPESGQNYQAFVPVERLFETYYDSESGQSDGADNYRLYQDTMTALNRGATDLKLDTSQFNTPTELFEAVNDRTKNLYVVTGRANNWDAAESEALGLTGHGKSRGGVNHATVMYRKVGDKLVPVEDDAGNAIVKTFKFDDPDTSKGFFGDLAQGALSILSVPPIALALSAATGGVSNLFSAATQPIVSTLIDAGINELAANVVTNAAVNSLLTEVMGGNAGDTFLSSLVSGAIGGTTAPDPSGGNQPIRLPGLGEQFLNQIGFNNLGIANLVDPSTLGRIAGTYAGSAITGTDPTKMLINQAITQGIKSLPGMSRSLSNEFQPGGEGFTLSDSQKAELQQELSSFADNPKVQGILGLPLETEQNIIAAANQLVPLLTAKGLSKQEAMMLASNIISAAKSA